MSHQELLTEVEDHVNTLFKEHKNDSLAYHNIEHTRKVVQHANEIGTFYQLDEESLFILSAAAWFHDVGYLFTGTKDHERTGVEIMKEFFSNKNLPSNVTDNIERCIMATKKLAHPIHLLERILCDADTYHFGTPEFKKTDSLVRKEIELQSGSTPMGWAARTITMLRNHKFQTAYCNDRLSSGKEENIRWLESMTQ